MVQLFNGDCLEVMKGIPDKSVDLIICDLPYGCLTNQTGESKGFYRKSHEGTNLTKKLAKQSGSSCAWDVKIDLDAFWKEVRRIRKSDHTPTIHFCTTKFGYDLIKSNEKEFRYDLVWDKQRGVSFLSANKMPMRSHEMIYVFSKAGANYNRKDIVGDFPSVKAWGKDETAGVYNFVGRTTEASGGRRCAKSVIPILNFGKKGRHPTEKPIDLYKWLIERYSKEGDTILDPTAGSFNSCAAALELKRKAIGIEKDEKFFKKAEERFAPNEIISPIN
jgi:site-specific DNA-methyltransferase (adenine-specific)